MTWYVYNAAGERVRKVTERPGVAGCSSATLLKERIYLGSFEVYRKYGGDGSTVALARETVHVRTAAKSALPRRNPHTGQRARRPAVPARPLPAWEPPRVIRPELDDQAQIISYEEYYPYGSTSYQACA